MAEQWPAWSTDIAPHTAGVRANRFSQQSTDMPTATSDTAADSSSSLARSATAQLQLFRGDAIACQDPEEHLWIPSSERGMEDSTGPAVGGQKEPSSPSPALKARMLSVSQPPANAFEVVSDLTVGGGAPVPAADAAHRDNVLDVRVDNLLSGLPLNMLSTGRATLLVKSPDRDSAAFSARVPLPPVGSPQAGAAGGIRAMRVHRLPQVVHPPKPVMDE